jgi:hypothetical protein
MRWVTMVNLSWSVSIHCKDGLTNPTYCRFVDSDFLETWETIEQTTIFDGSWVMSSHWLCVPPKLLVHAWGYGEAVCKLSGSVSFLTDQ